MQSSIILLRRETERVFDIIRHGRRRLAGVAHLNRRTAVIA